MIWAWQTWLRNFIQLLYQAWLKLKLKPGIDDFVYKVIVVSTTDTNVSTLTARLMEVVR